MPETFRRILRRWRKSSQLVQKEAADMLAVNIRTYQGWEEGKTEPSALAKAELERRMLNAGTGKDAPKP